MPVIEIKVDENQRELVSHGTAQFPLEIHHDHLNHFSERYIRCHWHEELEISVVLSGAVRCQLKEKSWELHEGEGLVINSCVPHSSSMLGEEPPVMLTVIFHPSLLYGTPVSGVYQKLLYPYMNTPALSGMLLSPDEADQMKQIDLLCQNRPFGYELQAKGMLCTLFSELLAPHEKLLSSFRPSSREALERLQILLDMIHSGYDSVLSLSELASRVSVSRESCSRFFKSMTGKTITQYLEDYRIMQSISLLQDGRYSITQVSYMVGFGNPGRFSAAFSKKTGCTPGQYRRRFPVETQDSIKKQTIR